MFCADVIVVADEISICLHIPDSPQIIIREFFIVPVGGSLCGRAGAGAGDGLQMCWPGTKQSSDQS